MQKFEGTCTFAKDTTLVVSGTDTKFKDFRFLRGTLRLKESFEGEYNKDNETWFMPASAKDAEYLQLRGYKAITSATAN